MCMTSYTAHAAAPSKCSVDLVTFLCVLTILIRSVLGVGLVKSKTFYFRTYGTKLRVFHLSANKCVFNALSVMCNVLLVMNVVLTSQLHSLKSQWTESTIMPVLPTCVISLRIYTDTYHFTCCLPKQVFTVHMYTLQGNCPNSSLIQYSSGEIRKHINHLYLLFIGDSSLHNVHIGADR